MADTEAAWAAFEAAGRGAAATRIVDRIAADPGRLDALTVEAAGLWLDLSKQPWSDEALTAGLALAQAAGLADARAALFGGEAANRSEGRAVLHPALRAPIGASYAALGEPISAEVETARARMQAFADGVRSGAITGAAGRPFRAVLHIGIGGSDLGPRLVWEALRPLDAAIDLRFAANVDPAEMAAAIHGLDARETLVVIVSKTFTTQETLSNAEIARAWLREALGDDAGAHLVAVSAAPEAATAFGVAADRVFAFRDWVGGRFSVWSAVGLSCAIGLGWDAFARLLAGAAAMDDHFREAPPRRNAPVLLALTQLLNRNALGRGARAVVPYAQRLRLLPAFLQQLEMESNGKSVTADGDLVTRPTAPVVFGDAGTNGQHAFFQLLHQGTDAIPVEFVAARDADGPPEAHAKLLANLIAQGEALLIGRPGSEVRADLAAQGLPPAEIDALASQRTFPGDRPSTLILMDALTPATLGALLALYEHKIFVEGVLWGVNSFDQWGVELGKTLAARILAEWSGETVGHHDASTARLTTRLAR